MEIAKSARRGCSRISSTVPGFCRAIYCALQMASSNNALDQLLMQLAAISKCAPQCQQPMDYAQQERYVLWPALCMLLERMRDQQAGCVLERVVGGGEIGVASGFH